MDKDTARRVRNTIAFGHTTSKVTIKDGVPVVQVRLSPIEVLSLRVVEKRGVGVNLPIGTPVVALFQSGDRSNGMVMGSLAPGERPNMAGDQDAALYGYGFSIVVASDGVHVTAPDVFLSGNLHVGGEVTAKAGSGASVTLTGHKHPTAAPGGPSVPTPGT